MVSNLKFLIIQTAFLGDVILATALIEKIILHYPNAKIDFLLRKGNESVLQNNHHIKNILIFDKRKKYQEVFRHLKKIRSREYDFVINVQRHFTTGLMAALSKGKNIIGFDKNPLSFFFHKKINHRFEGLHETERNQLLIEHLTDKACAAQKIYPSEADIKKAKPYMKASYITISAGSIWETKKYPLEKWNHFLAKLDVQYTVYFLGSKNEFEEIEKLLQGVKRENVFNLCGGLNIMASAVLMKSACMNFCNDSAPTHIASAINAPVASIYTSTSPRFGYAPISDNAHIIETKKILSCKPCTNHGKKKCPLKHYECGFSINTEQLLETIPYSKNIF